MKDLEKTICVSASFALSSLLMVHSAFAQDERELLKQSDIVFEGTVLRTGAATMSGIPTAATIIVRVDNVLDKPSSVLLRNGDSITVRVVDPSAFSQGTQATFYTQGWIYGEGIAVREIGHMASAAVAAAVASVGGQGMSQARQQQQDEDLRARVQAANVIVVGRVASIGPSTIQSFASTSQPPPISEHSPDWQEAVIEVESTIKGQEAEQVVVRFANSMDIAWYTYPKFTVGQEGTFILSQDELSGQPQAMRAGNRVNAYAAVKSMDVRPRADADRIRQLVNP